MIDFVFFDAGETLLRPEPSFPELAAEVIRSRGHDVSPQAVIEASRAVSGHFRKAADEGRAFSASAADSKMFWTSLYTDLMDELGLADPEAPAALFETFSDPGNYGLFPDAEPVLNELRERGYRLGVISNFEGWLDDLLGRLGVRELFEVVAISGPLGWEKPDPRIFKWAVAEAGVRAEACVHVGDQPYFDAEAATECGLGAVLLDRHGRWGDVRGFPRITSLASLPTVVEDLRRGRSR